MFTSEALPSLWMLSCQIQGTGATNELFTQFSRGSPTSSPHTTLPKVAPYLELVTDDSDKLRGNLGGVLPARGNSRGTREFEV